MEFDTLILHMSVDIMSDCLSGCHLVLVPAGTEMILGFASRYACLGDLDKWAASRLQVACK